MAQESQYVVRIEAFTRTARGQDPHVLVEVCGDSDPSTFITALHSAFIAAGYSLEMLRHVGEKD